MLAFAEPDYTSRSRGCGHDSGIGHSDIIFEAEALIHAESRSSNTCMDELYADTVGM